MPMSHNIITLSVDTRQMPNTKPSKGGKKITVKLTVACEGYAVNRADVRIVFHHDMVFFTEIRYYERFVRGHKEKSNFSKPIKSMHPFNVCIYGYTYDGNGLDAIAMADMAFKMYRNQYLNFRVSGHKYLNDI